MNSTPGALNLGRVVCGHGRSLLFEPQARSTHLYVVGATGSGKSKFLESLIRQDVVHWRQTRSGLMLLDPHGSLCDALVRWMAWERIDRPLLLLDLRQDDWIVSYNLLQQRELAKASVIVDSLVMAMAHVWGRSGTDETPLFARWASAILQALYEKQRPLTDAMHLIDSAASEVRLELTKGLDDTFARRDWSFANELRPLQFEEQLSSTINRLRRLLGSDVMQRMFGQPEATLDLRRAIDEGWIILVNLAQEGRKISEENARMLGTLLLTDLWDAAKERGKRKGVKPFHIYIDEFQNFVTPTIAENLDQARGFGLHLTLAHQFPSQVRLMGPIGERLFASLMNNACSKVAFRLEYEPDLKTLAQWLYMGVLDPDQVKHELYSTKVMDYRLEYQNAYSHVHTTTTSDQRSDGTAQSSTQGSTRDNNGDIVARTWNETIGGSQSAATSTADSDADGVSSVPMLMPVMGKELSSVQFRSLEEQLFRSMAVLFDQQQRQCVVRLAGMKAPVSVFTPFVREAYGSPERIQRFVESCHRKWPFVLPGAVAAQRLLEREQRFERDDRLGMPRELPAAVPLEVVGRQLPPAGSAATECAGEPLKLEGLELQPRDVRFLVDLFDSRISTIKQAEALHYGTYDVAKRRLLRLAEAGLIEPIPVKTAGTGKPPTVYAFATRAFRLLHGAGQLKQFAAEQWDRKLRKRFKFSASTMEHELDVMEAKSALSPAIAAVPGWTVEEFGVWPERYRFKARRLGRRIVQRPDGYLRLVRIEADGSRRVLHFFLELDRGTEQLSVLQGKADGYRQHYQDGGFARWLGKNAEQPAVAFRVLFIVPSSLRQTNAAAALRQIQIGEHVWIATQEDFLREPLGGVWITPATEARRFALLGEPIASASPVSQPRLAKSAPKRRQQVASPMPPVPAPEQPAPSAAPSGATMRPAAMSEASAPKRALRPPVPSTPVDDHNAKYLRHLLTTAANAKGWTVDATKDGIDLWLEKGSLRIGCQLLTEPTADGVAQRLTRCVSAQPTLALAIAPDRKRLNAAARLAKRALPNAALALVRFVTTAEAITAIDELKEASVTDAQIVCGKKVNVNRNAVSLAEAVAKQQAVTRIVTQGLSKSRKGGPRKKP